MATSTLPTGGMIDPTKQAEYPVLLGDRLSRKDASPNSRLFNLNYNYKSKSTSAQQTIARSSQSRDLYNLTVTDKAPNAENTLTYKYEGSVEPEQAAGDSEAHEYVLVFDSDRKAFVLEPVARQLNFNLRSAPAKTEKQVIEQYEQLRTLQLDDQPTSGDDQAPDGNAEDDDGPPDESNPYDFRHFLPKEDDENEKSDVDHVLPDTPAPSTKPGTPALVTTKPAPSPKPPPKTQTNPFRPKKTEPAKKKTEPPKKKEEPPALQPSAKPEPEPEPEPFVEVEEAKEPEPKSSPSDTGAAALSSQKAVPSPGSNIIIDGDLIIDMGSPPPTRRKFNINPAHFSSNNTPEDGAEEDDGSYEQMEDLRLPSPAGNTAQSTFVGGQEDATPTTPAKEEEVEDDDALAAEMEAAFEESALEEENAHTTQPYQQRQYNAPSEDESEVSEEE